jgi:hypothetical protein
VPLPVAIGSATVMLPLPPKVTLMLDAVIALPLETSKVKVPLSELILTALVLKVMRPESVLLLARFRITPAGQLHLYLLM